MTAGLNYYKIVLLQYETFGMKTRTKKSGKKIAKVHCCMKCPQILREKTSSEKYTVFSL